MDSSEKKLRQLVGGKPDLLQNLPSMRTFINLAGIKDERREVLLKTIEIGVPYDMTRKKHLTGEDVGKYKEIFVNAGLTEAHANYAVTIWTHILSIESDDEARSAHPGLYTKKTPEMLAENQPSWTKETESAKKDKANQAEIIQKSSNDVPVVKKKAVFKSCLSTIFGCGCATLILAIIAAGIYYFFFHNSSKATDYFHSLIIKTAVSKSPAASGSSEDDRNSIKQLYEFGKYPVRPDGPMEPIIWEIVDEQNGELYLVTRNIVDAITATSPSSIVSWLNYSFYSDAFTEKEKSQILCDENTVASQRDQTRVKLLSENDLNKYYPNIIDRKAMPTPYAAKIFFKRKGDEKDLYSYWIFSENGETIIDKKGKTRKAEYFVSSSFSDYSGNIYKTYGMRPMIRIKKPKQK